MINVAVIIANWNGKKYLRGCLESLRNQTYKNFQVIFVDNGSDDGSVDFVRENYPEVMVKEIDRNIGFAGGYNLGFRLAMKNEKIQWLVALNNDTKLDEKYLEEMVACAKHHSEAGSIQPKVLNFFEKDKIDCAGIYITRDGTAHNRGYSEIDKGQFEEEKEIFGVNATAALFSRKALEKTKLAPGNFFDRDFFAYYEDVDLAWRMRLASFKAIYCPKARVFHVHSGTAGKASLFKAYYLHRNYFFTVFKNYPFGIMVRTLGWRFLSYGRLVFNIFSGQKRETEFAGGQGKMKVALVILKAWGSVFANILSISKKRHFIQKGKRINAAEFRKWVNS